MIHQRSQPAASALSSPDVRLATSASIRTINTSDIYRMTCCRLSCGRLSRLPAFRLRNRRGGLRSGGLRQPRRNLTVGTAMTVWIRKAIHPTNCSVLIRRIWWFPRRCIRRPPVLREYPPSSVGGLLQRFQSPSLRTSLSPGNKIDLLPHSWPS